MAKRVLIVAALSGFIKAFLHSDIAILQQKGYEVYCAANNLVTKEENNKEIIESLGAKFIQIDFDSKKPLSRQNFKAYRQFKKIIRDYDFDLIHSHTPIAALVARLASRKLRKKGTISIYTTHGLACSKNSSKKEWFIYYNIEKHLTKYTDAIITINHEDYDLIKNKMKFDKVEYIPGVGYDYYRYHNVNIDRDKYRSDLGLTNDDILVLSIGELSVRKNHSVIIKALGILNNPNIVYAIAGRFLGNDDFSNHLLELAKQNNVRLKLLGFRRDIPELICCSDIGAIPSIREGLGLAGVQSLAGGKPLVGTDVQGIKDYIIEGKTGYLCTPHDALGFSEAITKLIYIKDDESIKEECYKVALEFDKEKSYYAKKKIYDKYLRESK